MMLVSNRTAALENTFCIGANTLQRRLPPDPRSIIIRRRSLQHIGFGNHRRISPSNLSCTEMARHLFFPPPLKLVSSHPNRARNTTPGARTTPQETTCTTPSLLANYPIGAEQNHDHRSRRIQSTSQRRNRYINDWVMGPTSHMYVSVANFFSDQESSYSQ